MISVEQQYAKIALESVQNIHEDNQVEYRRLCLLFPALILNSGLRLAVKFFQHKSKEAPLFSTYLQDLSRALGIEDLLNEKNSLPENSFAYRSLSMKAFKAASWFKRYAVICLQEEEQ